MIWINLKLTKNRAPTENTWYDSHSKKTIVLDILQIKEKEICPDYISKINSNCEKQIILLKIPNEEKEGQHYFDTMIHGIIRIHRITSKHQGLFYFLN